MGFADRYLEKQDHRFGFIAPEEMPFTPMIVVIPCFNEPELSITLLSLFKCDSPLSDVGILIMVNDADDSAAEERQQNNATLLQIEELKKTSPGWIKLYSIYAEKIPSKHAGAGWARKIGMDWVISHFNRFDVQNGIIISLDADATVEPNYFLAIENYFQNHQKSIGATLYFEHPISNCIDPEAIIFYELYMRYYKHALDYCGYPHTMYTVGSCFAVKAGAYVAQGGMNRNKAGEDFYFLNKLIPFGEIGVVNTTTVFPSSRLSNRVPFGTGPSLQRFLDGNNNLELTYPLKSFEIIKSFLKKIETLFFNNAHISPSIFTDNMVLQNFLIEHHLMNVFIELKKNCGSNEVFRKRFFHLFNAFMMLKWLNYAQFHGYVKANLLAQSQLLAEKLGFLPEKIPDDPKLMLKFYRNLDKAGRKV